MRVDVYSNEFTGEVAKMAVDKLNEEYASMGLKVKNVTMYVRFEDETGATVDPRRNGIEIHKTMRFTRQIDVDDIK